MSDGVHILMAATLGGKINKNQTKKVKPNAAITTYTPDGLLDPNFVTGITDGDGTFGCSIVEKKTGIGWGLNLYFDISASANPANLRMLHRINQYFGNIGTIRVDRKSNMYKLTIKGVKNCLIVKAHFEKYPLLTYKLVYYQVWCKILKLMENGAHLTLNGLNKIVGLKSLFKLGLTRSPKLVLAFPNYPKYNLPKYLPKLHKMTLGWIAGFINADGHFTPGLGVSLTGITGYRVNPLIKITQHKISICILHQVAKVLGMGAIYKVANNCFDIHITGLERIQSFSFC